MSKFTSGPWKCSRTHPCSADYWYVILDANGRGPIMDVGGKDVSGQIAEAKHLVTKPEVIEANAHLIAAAPDLLAACIEAVRLYEQGCVDRGYKDEPNWIDEVRDQLDAAITKATKE